MGNSASAEEIQSYMKQQATIIDVRSPSEFQGGHHHKAINIPLGEITKSEKLPKDKNAYIICYCLSGARSGRAVQELQSLGYKNVINGGTLGNMQNFN